MLAYDLTDTLLAQSDLPVRVPRDGELLAITVALLVDEGRTFSDLNRADVMLTARNYRRVAELIEERTPPLAREFGDPTRLRGRLKELVGLRVTRRALH